MGAVLSGPSHRCISGGHWCHRGQPQIDQWLIVSGLVRRGPAIMKAGRLSYRSPDIPFLAVVSFVKMSSSISPLLPRTGERQSKGEQDTWHLSCFQLVCGPKKKVSPFQKSSFWVPVTEGDKLRNQKTVHRREFFYFAY